ncbi:MAG: 30S ribosomal protein S5 [Candidatus Andersenbacteria bacterium]|nr:30S ribosomal protein S5 [Candidatus Andersenbacteria bacterium]
MTSQNQTNRPSTAAPTGGRRHVFAELGTEQPYDHVVLEVARVVRVVKGGRRFSFRASVVAGNRAGSVGLGMGKSRDVQMAIQKAYQQAAKHMVTVCLAGGTLPGVVEAKYKGARVWLRPAQPGRGIIAGGTVRVVAGLAGVRDVVGKRHGSSNVVSNAGAALRALASTCA